VKPPGVLVLDAQQNSALAIIRSLAGRAGPISGADETWAAKSLYSRWCRRRFRYASPATDVRGFLSDVVRAASATDRCVVIPVTEKTLWPLSLARASLPPGIVLPLPAHAVLEKALNKATTLRVAEQIGIPIPATRSFRDLDELRAESPRLPYPLVVKDTQSQYVMGNQVVSGPPPQYARGPRDLLRILGKRDRRLPAPMVQEFIPGNGRGVFALFRRGEPIAWFAHRRIRDTRPTGSGSAVRESVELDPVLRVQGERLLRALDWEGVAMVEFRDDDRDGISKLMEVNGRFWNSLALSIAAGVDFPWLLYRMACGLEAEPAVSYRIGVRCRWILGDSQHLRAVLRGRPAGYTGAFPERLPTVKAFLADFLDSRMHYDVWSPADPLPCAAELAAPILRRLQRWIGRSGWRRGDSSGSSEFPAG